MTSITHLLDNNKAWAVATEEDNPGFFIGLSKQQNPEYLWIGCSDSRVPANQIVDLRPGEVFVHRNIANVVAHSDLNCLSVIQFAVEVLGVKHIIVCGHYGCGGIAAALDNQEHGLIDNWLQNIGNVYRLNREEVERIEDPKEKQDRMCELNVIEQVRNVCHTTFVKKAWADGKDLSVHGWIYRLDTGIIKDLGISCGPAAD